MTYVWIYEVKKVKPDLIDVTGPRPAATIDTEVLIGFVHPDEFVAIPALVRAVMRKRGEIKSVYLSPTGMRQLMETLRVNKPEKCVNMRFAVPVGWLLGMKAPEKILTSAIKNLVGLSQVYIPA